MNGSTIHLNGVGNGSAGTNGTTAPAVKKRKLDPKEELAEFEKVFKILMDECLNEGSSSSSKEIGDAISHFIKVCE